MPWGVIAGELANADAVVAAGQCFQLWVGVKVRGLTNGRRSTRQGWWCSRRNSSFSYLRSTKEAQVIYGVPTTVEV